MNFVEAVLVFALITSLFETVILLKIRPRTRLRMLGSPYVVALIHTIVFGTNIAVHYGTLVGSMTAITAALTSFVTVPIVRKISGYIHDGRYYAGWIKYPEEQLT